MSVPPFTIRPASEYAPMFKELAGSDTHILAVNVDQTSHLFPLTFEAASALMSEIIYTFGGPDYWLEKSCHLPCAGGCR